MRACTMVVVRTRSGGKKKARAARVTFQKGRRLFPTEATSRMSKSTERQHINAKSLHRPLVPSVKGFYPDIYGKKEAGAFYRFNLRSTLLCYVDTYLSDSQHTLSLGQVPPRRPAKVPNTVRTLYLETGCRCQYIADVQHRAGIRQCAGADGNDSESPDVIAPFELPGVDAADLSISAKEGVFWIRCKLQPRYRRHQRSVRRQPQAEVADYLDVDSAAAIEADVRLLGTKPATGIFVDSSVYPPV
ncbi:hypothetical protein C8R47DRAFT_1190768 [Mycena vitilis]|nr:hypothetical protein C8R47DRAFT_1190768 [Mycena vitilis]